MRLRNVTGSREVIASSRFVVHEPFEQRGKWNEVFGSSNPIQIEIGMGKGQFMMQLAAQNPEINYIGIEKYSTVLLRAVQKMEVQEITNLRLIRMDAEEICEVFGKGEVSKIYLNFSDPWPRTDMPSGVCPRDSFLRGTMRFLRTMGGLSSRRTIRRSLTLRLASLSLLAGS